MAPVKRNQKVWETPSLTVYGSVKEITQQTKYKVSGAGDDVILNGVVIPGETLSS